MEKIVETSNDDKNKKMAAKYFLFFLSAEKKSTLLLNIKIFSIAVAAKISKTNNLNKTLFGNSKVLAVGQKYEKKMGVNKTTARIKKNDVILAILINLKKNILIFYNILFLLF